MVNVNLKTMFVKHVQYKPIFYLPGRIPQWRTGVLWSIWTTGWGRYTATPPTTLPLQSVTVDCLPLFWWWVHTGTACQLMKWNRKDWSGINKSPQSEMNLKNSQMHALENDSLNSWYNICFYFQKSRFCCKFYFE